jgi:hypothetical protein
VVRFRVAFALGACYIDGWQTDPAAKAPPARFTENLIEEQKNGLLRTEKAANDKPADACSPGEYPG